MAESIYVDGLGHGTNPIPAAARRGAFMMTGAVLGIDRASGTLPEAWQEQCRNVFANLVVILEAAGMSVEDVLKITFHVHADVDRQEINAHWVRMFPDPAARPARHVVVSTTLPGKSKIQCVAFAVRS